MLQAFRIPFAVSTLFVFITGWNRTSVTHAAPPPRPQFEAPQADASLPNVLLIGDSISIGYTLPVRRELDAVANVYRPPVNCGDTRRGVKSIDDWLGNRHWDVIHFNFGLHDLKYIDRSTGQLVPLDHPAAERAVPLSNYKSNLQQIAQRLRQTGATIIWRPTTPVPEGSKGRVPGDEVKYNAAAVEVMQQVGDIQIDPVGQLATEPPIADLQLPANVHYTPSGSQALAESIGETIRKALDQSSAQ